MHEISFSEFVALLALEGRPPSEDASPLWCALTRPSTRRAHNQDSIGDRHENAIDNDDVLTAAEYDRARAFLAREYPRSGSPQLQFDEIVYRSPQGLFSVNFSPDFAVQLDDYNCAIHIWRGSKSLTNICAIEVALGIIATAARSGQRCPQDIALLRLDVETLHRVSDTCDRSSLAHDMIRQLENLFLADVLAAGAASKSGLDRRWQ